MQRVLLVVPPYHALTSPALSVSLLKAALARLGVEVDLLYANLRFGTHVGRALYDRVAQNARALAGDWLFAGDLFGERAPAASAYTRDILSRQLGLGPDEIAELDVARASVPAFLDLLVDEIEAGAYDVAVTCADLAVGEDRIQNCATLALFRRLKARNPALVTIMSGANCQGELGAAIHDLFPFVDYVCAGEAERVLPRFIARLLAGETTIDRPGILGRATPRLPGPTIGPPLVLDLDGLPYPDFDDYFAQHAAATLGPGAQPILTFETSRGCWWGEKHHCTFCGLNGAGMQYRSKSPQRALDELDYLVERHRVRSIFASDMILNPRYFDTFLTSLAGRPLPPSIFFETKSNLTKAQLRTLAQAGVREFQPGVESLSTPMLRLMAKGVTELQNVRVLKWCAELGVAPFWNILYGFPGEDPAEYARMARLLPSLTHLAPPYRIIQIRLDRFSPNFDEAEARGFTNVRPAGAYPYVYPLAADELDRLAYYFDYDYADGRDPSTYVAPIEAAVNVWRDSSDVARLEMRVADDTVTIEDTRPGAARPETVLRGPARLAYLALDAGATVREVVAHLERTAGSAAPATEQVQGWLDAWLADRLVFREGDRYLGLATNPAERVPLPAERLLALMTAGGRR